MLYLERHFIGDAVPIIKDGAIGKTASHPGVAVIIIVNSDNPP